MRKAITYYPGKREFVRPSRCVRGDGRPKHRFPDQATAEEAANELRARAARRPDAIEVYECPVCDGWHHGNARLNLPTKNHRVVDREAALLVELGERALVQMLSESSYKRGRRTRTIAQRLPRRRVLETAR